MKVYQLIKLLSEYPTGAEVYIGTLPNDESALKVWDEHEYPDGKAVCELETGA